MATKAIGTVVQDGLVLTGTRVPYGPFSDLQLAQLPSKLVAPLPPELLGYEIPEGTVGTVLINVRLPVANTDGSALPPAELIRMRLYYSTSEPVTKDSPYTDFPVAESFYWAPPEGQAYYVALAVCDSHGNWSELSNTLALPELPSAGEFISFWAHFLGPESIFSNNSPNPGYVSWSNVTIRFRDETYSVADGNTNKRYIYWRSATPTVFQTSDSVPALSNEDVLVALNLDGTCYLFGYRPMFLADVIRAGSLQSTNWSEAEGVLLDLDQGHLYVGGSSSPKLSWDGSTLSVVGNITVTGGSVPYSYVTGGPPANADNTATVISSGLITTGRIELGSGSYIKAGIDGAGTSDSDIRIWAGATYANRASAPFRVTQGGALYATSATIGGTFSGSFSGSANISSGSLGNYVAIDSSGINVGTYGSIRGGKTGYGAGSGFWLGYSGGYKFDIGDSSYYMRWDGSNLYLTGRVYSQYGSYLVTGSTQRTDINYSYSHRIALYTSSGSLGTFIDTGAITIYDSSYTPVKLQPTAPHIYLYPYAGGSATIRSYGSLSICSGGTFQLDSFYGTFDISAPCGTILRGDSSYVYMPYTSVYWKYGGPTYGGDFWTPAGGIYVYIGSSRYAIPYYGPV